MAVLILGQQPTFVTHMEDFKNATDPRKVLKDVTTGKNNLQNEAEPEKYQKSVEVDDSYLAKQKIAEITKFVDAQKSTKTVNKPKSDINTWKRFYVSVGEVRKLCEIPSVRLSKLLGHICC